MKIYDSIWQKHNDILVRLPHLKAQISEHYNASIDVNHETQYQQIDKNFNELSVWLQGFDDTVASFKRLESKTQLSFTKAEQDNILRKVNLFEFEQANQSLLNKQQPLTTKIIALEKQNADMLTAWQSAKDTHTADAYHDFITSYPNSPHVQEATQAIENLKAQEGQKPSPLKKLMPMIMVFALLGLGYVGYEYVNKEDADTYKSEVSEKVTKKYIQKKEDKIVAVSYENDPSHTIMQAILERKLSSVRQYFLSQSLNDVGVYLDKTSDSELDDFLFHKLVGRHEMQTEDIFNIGYVTTTGIQKYPHMPPDFMNKTCELFPVHCELMKTLELKEDSFSVPGCKVEKDDYFIISIVGIKNKEIKAMVLFQMDNLDGKWYVKKFGKDT